MSRRRWEVWALYDPPVLQERCWTRSGARRAMARWFRPTRWWLSCELRDAHGEHDPEVMEDYAAPSRKTLRALLDQQARQDAQEARGGTETGRCGSVDAGTGERPGEGQGP